LAISAVIALVSLLAKQWSSLFANEDIAFLWWIVGVAVIAGSVDFHAYLAKKRRRED